MKKLLFLFGIICSLNSYAQVGIGTNNPQSTFDLRGSVQLPYLVTTSNIELDERHHTVGIGGNTLGIEVVLPTLSSNEQGRRYVVKNLNPSGSVDIWVLSKTGSLSRDGITSTSINLAPGEAVEFVRTPNNGTGTTVLWQAISDSRPKEVDTSVFTHNGALTANRTIDLSDRTIAFPSTATTGSNHFSIDGATLSVNTVNDRVGVGTINPQTKLDVEGNLRIGTRGSGVNDTKYLTISDAGIVNEITIPSRKVKQTLTIPAGETRVFTNNLGFVDTNVIITSKNNCNRTMISSFVSSEGALAFLGGIARDKLATGTIQAIQSGESSFSPRIIVTFPGLLACEDGGNNTQFDFRLKKLSNTQYEIINNGNITKTYTITWTEF